MATKTQKKINPKKALEPPAPVLKPAQVYKPKSDEWHRKIARNRGESWKKNVMAGRRDALLNPSNIRIARLSLNIHQSTIAQRLNMSESAFGAIERGKQKVKEVVAKQIAKMLNLPLKKLFTPVDKEKFVAVTRKQNV